MDINLYQVIDTDKFMELQLHLGDRQLLLAYGAINYHSLVNPGVTLEYRFYFGTDGEYPRLTDVSTLRGEWAKEAEEIGSFKAKSLVRGKPRPDEGLDAEDQPVIDNGIRYIRLSIDEPNDSKARQHEEKSRKQKIYDFLEKRNVQVLDAIRETKIRINEIKLKQHIQRSTDKHIFSSNAVMQQQGFRFVRPVPPFAGSPKAMLIGLHWLQMGGAERWAFESVQIAKEQGLLPIVITDQLSHHYWITRPELDGAILIPMTMPIQYWKGDIPLLRFLSENFDITSIFVHHNVWLYANLPWFRRYRPETKIVDSTHIIEYGGGGFPGMSVAYDDFIDIHHVISPQLVDWMVDTQGVSPEKVVLAPLIGLTTDTELGFKEHDPNKPFTIAFVGRLARQKRPDIFLLAADKIREKVPNIRFILHGEGELSPIVEKHLDELGLREFVLQRRENDPVSQTLEESDLLFITSTNEGLTLTALEAIAAGIPVVSTDVGSQKTLIPEDALVPRSAQSILRKVPDMVKRLADDPGACRKLWETEAAAVEEFSALRSANNWTKEWMEGLKN